MINNKPITKKLLLAFFNGECLSKENLLEIINNRECFRLLITKKASEIQKKIFGNSIYKRGLIECSSFCKNNCDYCGIRSGNPLAQRYRLNKNTILDCCSTGYSLGFRTFVLQGGEDESFSPDFVETLVKEIKQKFSDCAVTLSFGEKPKEVYALWKKAGADRYLLRHEASNKQLYEKLHTHDLKYRSFEYRKECLFNLKKLGFQTGSGFMVGAPFQTEENIAEDLLFLKDLNPEMIGIGPFIPHKETPLKNFPAGKAELTTFIISMLRIMFPYSLIPSTTALATISSDGREQGILAGANVVMPNLSPCEVREKYDLYEKKSSTGAESAEGLKILEKRITKIGFSLVNNRGDYIGG